MSPYNSLVVMLQQKSHVLWRAVHTECEAKREKRNNSYAETRSVEKAWQRSKTHVRHADVYIEKNKSINQKNTNAFHNGRFFLSVWPAGGGRTLSMNALNVWNSQLVWIKWEGSMRRASKTKINYNSGNKLFPSNRPHYTIDNKTNQRFISHRWYFMREHLWNTELLNCA